MQDNRLKMVKEASNLTVRLCGSPDDRRAAQALRYDVFVRELGGDGPLVDHTAGLERDRFDDFAEQLVLLDGERVVGVYRFMDSKAAQAAGGFYCADEYDLGVLERSGRRLLELGRSCLHKDYRGGTGLMMLWQGLADIVRARRVDVLFGVASFHGVDRAALAQPLSLLQRDHLAPPDIRVKARLPDPMDIEPVTDRAAAMRQVPGLIKAYLRLGGFVGEGAFVDHAFNTTDVCLVLDLDRMNPRQVALYGGTS